MFLSSCSYLSKPDPDLVVMMSAVNLWKALQLASRQFFSVTLLCALNVFIAEKSSCAIQFFRGHHDSSTRSHKISPIYPR
jgi:hypothetical protein